MLHSPDKDRLDEVLRTIEIMKLRFPVAEIVKKTGVSKSVVSEYLAGKKPISDNFYRTFKEHFVRPDAAIQKEFKKLFDCIKEFGKTNDEPHTIEAIAAMMDYNKSQLQDLLTGKAIVSEDHIHHLKRHFPFLKRNEPGYKGKESQEPVTTIAMLQEMIRNTTTLVNSNALLVQNNAVLVKTNADQTTIMGKLTNTSLPVPDLSSTTALPERLVDRIAEEGVRDHLWASKEAGLKVLSSYLAGIGKKKKSVNN